MREDLYQCVKKYKERTNKDHGLKQLDKESQRYFKKVLEDFELGGMKLSE